MRLAFAAIAIAAAVGCMSSRVPLPTWDVGGQQSLPGAEIHAQLEGRRTELGGCVWLRLSDGRIRSAVWPRGYWATLEPDLRVYATTGELVGVAGDELEMTGGLMPADLRPASLPEHCDVGPVIQIVDVIPSAKSGSFTSI